MSGEGLEAVASRMTAPMQQAHTELPLPPMAWLQPPGGAGAGAGARRAQSGTNNKMANKKIQCLPDSRIEF